MTKQDFIWIYVNTLNSMEKDELKQLLIEFYRVATEESRMVGVQKIQVFTQSVLVTAILLSFTGIIMTQYKNNIINGDFYFHSCNWGDNFLIFHFICWLLFDV